MWTSCTKSMESYSHVISQLLEDWCRGIWLNHWHWIKRLRVRFQSMPGTFVLQQEMLSTLLLSTQVYYYYYYYDDDDDDYYCCCYYHYGSHRLENPREGDIGNIRRNIGDIQNYVKLISYIKWIIQFCSNFYCCVSILAFHSPNPHCCLGNFVNDLYYQVTLQIKVIISKIIK